MKKILSSLLCLLLVFALCACEFNFNISGGEKYEDSRIQMDLNPSVEIVIDEDGKVVSITGLNDDGEILLSGEAIVGKDFEVAVDTIVGLSVQMGYINKEDADEIEFSVSGDSEYASKVFDKIKTQASETLAKYGIDEVTIKQSVAETIDEVKAQINAYLPEYDFEGLTEEEIYAKLGEVREEYKGVSLELVSQFKDSQEIGELVNQVKAAIDYLKENQIGGTAALVIQATTGISDISVYLEQFEEKFNSLLETYGSYLLDTDGIYQKAKDELLNKKVEVAKLKNEISELDPESSEYQIKAQLITQAETALSQAEVALEQVKTAVDGAISVANALVEQAKTLVQTVVNALKNVSTELAGLVEQVASYDFSSFEASFSTEIAARETELAEYKAQIIASLNVTPNEE